MFSPSEIKEKMIEMGKICIPGMRLSLLNKDNIAGPGTYELRGYIYASFAGVLKMEKNENGVSKERQTMEGMLKPVTIIYVK